MNRFAVLLACGSAVIASGCASTRSPVATADCDAMRMRMMEAAAKRQHVQLIWVNCPQPKVEAREPNAAAATAVALGPVPADGR